MPAKKAPSKTPAKKAASAAPKRFVVTSLFNGRVSRSVIAAADYIVEGGDAQFFSGDGVTVGMVRNIHSVIEESADIDTKDGAG